MTQHRTETVSVGHDLAGTINQTPRGFEVFDARGKYLHTETTIQAARKALFNLHRDGEKGLARA